MKLSSALAVAAVAVVAFGATAVVAQQNPIEARQELMKSAGAQTKTGAGFARGQAPFDLAKAKEIFATYQNVAQKAPALFPPDSKTGNDTTAAPAIWEKMDDFKARFVTFGEEAKAAEAATTDLDSFKTQFAMVTKNCGACHETYRIKKN